MGPAQMSSNSSQTIVVIDPCSTGAYVSLEASRRGFQVVAVWSKESIGTRHSIPKECRFIEYVAVIEEQPSVSQTVDRIYSSCSGFNIAAVIAGSESGVNLAEST